MITAGVNDVKNQLSRYLSFVKKGEDVLVTERGKVIARIICENPQETPLIDFHILNFTRPEGGGCIVIRRRPITR